MIEDNSEWESSVFRECMNDAYASGFQKALSETSWYAMSNEQERSALRAGLSSRYPSRILVPLFRRTDSDDVICGSVKELSENEIKIIVIHDFAEIGWEASQEWPDFAALLNSKADWDW